MKDTGVRNGFIILSINDTSVDNTEDLERIINNKLSTDEVLFLKTKYPKGKTAYYAVTLD